MKKRKKPSKKSGRNHFKKLKVVLKFNENLSEEMEDAIWWELLAIFGVFDDLIAEKGLADINTLPIDGRPERIYAENSQT